MAGNTTSMIHCSPTPTQQTQGSSPEPAKKDLTGAFFSFLHQSFLPKKHNPAKTVAPPATPDYVTHAKTILLKRFTFDESLQPKIEDCLSKLIDGSPENLSKFLKKCRQIEAHLGRSLTARQLARSADSIFGNCHLQIIKMLRSQHGITARMLFDQKYAYEQQAREQRQLEMHHHRMHLHLQFTQVVSDLEQLLGDPITQIERAAHIIDKLVTCYGLYGKITMIFPKESTRYDSLIRFLTDDSHNPEDSATLANLLENLKRPFLRAQFSHTQRKDIDAHFKKLQAALCHPPAPQAKTALAFHHPRCLHKSLSADLTHMAVVGF